MKISVVTLFPELYGPFLDTSLIKRARERGDLSCDIVSLFSVCAPKERADGPTFGHGPGLLLRPEVVERAVTAQESAHGKALKIFFSPQGATLDQYLVHRLYERIMATGGHCMLLPARYEGMDARVEEEYADELISVGDFVLMGGDLPAMMLMEALLRFVPGLVGKQESVDQDSFMGPFVDYPEYTAPVTWHGREVPEVIRSGNHAAMQEWRRDQAARRTVERHFSWLRSHELSKQEKALAERHIPPHYAVLMHDNVLVQDGVEGTSSVTSIDIHDIARSAKTYGLKNYFVVTPLADQQEIVKTLLGFWQQGAGVTYNPSRHEAVSAAVLASTLDGVIAQIEQIEGKKPILLGTSAREVVENRNSTYYEQEMVWREKRPVLIIFGTAQGLGPSVLQRCEYVLGPIEGFSSFNHLSVRSAAAVIFDRWLGINKKTRVLHESKNNK
jgi:tRNA (guanine37-N1)-methyltransferase